MIKISIFNYSTEFERQRQRLNTKLTTPPFYEQVPWLYKPGCQHSLDGLS